MDWQDDLLDRLEARVPCGYAADGELASEPTALAGLTLLMHGHRDGARKAANWLAERQAGDGSVGVTAARPQPGWPTAWAIMLWQAFDTSAAAPAFEQQQNRAVHWSLAQHGETLPRSDVFGHDSTIVGWSWAANTHSWLEPSAMFVLALKAVGESQHPRTREAVRLLIDRQLPNGGCNYGNTVVMGQTLLAHIQPTGLAMMALGGEDGGDFDDPRIKKSLAYLQRELTIDTATASLCFGLLGLAAHGHAHPNRDEWLTHAYNRVNSQDASPYKLSLIGLASADKQFLSMALLHGAVSKLQ